MQHKSIVVHFEPQNASGGKQLLRAMTKLLDYAD